MPALVGAVLAKRELGAVIELNAERVAALAFPVYAQLQNIGAVSRDLEGVGGLAGGDLGWVAFALGDFKIGLAGGALDGRDAGRGGGGFDFDHGGLKRAGGFGFKT